jgi:hypothetical protein
MEGRVGEGAEALRKSAGRHPTAMAGKARGTAVEVRHRAWEARRWPGNHAGRRRGVRQWQWLSRLVHTPNSAGPRTLTPPFHVGYMGLQSTRHVNSQLKEPPSLKSIGSQALTHLLVGPMRTTARLTRGTQTIGSLELFED